MPDWKNWSPFQSAEAKEICAHLTTAERRSLQARGALVGFAISVVPQLPLFLGFSHWLGPDGTLIFALIGLIVVYFSVPFLHASIRRFLCNTEWARAQGYRPDELPLFDIHFGVKHLLALMTAVAIVATIVWHLRNR
jgi:hypothetical protein